MKRTRTIATVTVLAALSVVSLSACNSSNSGNQADQSKSNQQLKAYQISQPIPQADWSQYRETLINVEQAMIKGVATTTYFYNMGSNVPIKSCPSIGFPVAATSQLTNPQAVTDGGNLPGTGSGNVTISQLEPNGTFTGNSSGTYVVCVQPDGVKQIDYWEGSVETDGGASHLSGGVIVNDSSTVTALGHK